MIERIVANWLTSAGERGYQDAFAQLLLSEGMTVLHATVHHPHEHGKDLLALDPTGRLFAFQLKGGDLTLSGFESIEAQLIALSMTAVSYPGVEPPRRPDQAILVTSGNLTAPARSRLSVLNDGFRSYGSPTIGLIEHEQLVARIVGAQSSHLPSTPEALNHFLEIMLSDGLGPLPIAQFASYLEETLIPESPASPLNAERAITATALFTANMLMPWSAADNHLPRAEGWLLYCLSVLRLAERDGLAEPHWKPSFELARDAALGHLRNLVDEAEAKDDLIIPHVVEGLVYPTRALLVCGYASALLLAVERTASDQPLRDKVYALLKREMPHCQAVGEGGAGAFILIANALALLGEPVPGAVAIFGLAAAFVERNSPEGDRDDAIADPYHRAEEVLISLMTAPDARVNEDWRRHSYLAHILLDWLVRRDLRPVAERLWPAITKLHHCEFCPSTPQMLLSGKDPSGHLTFTEFETPTSWSRLEESAKTLNETSLPHLLWQELELVAFLPLLFPQRMTKDVAKAIDYLSGVPVSIVLESDGSQESSSA